MSIKNPTSATALALTGHATRWRLVPVKMTTALVALATSGALGCTSPAPAWPTTPTAANDARSPGLLQVK